jgi:hypothetical protein
MPVLSHAIDRISCYRLGIASVNCTVDFELGFQVTTFRKDILAQMVHPG